MDLDAEYCGSSADEEEDDVELNYTISKRGRLHLERVPLQKGCQRRACVVQTMVCLYRGVVLEVEASQIDPTEIPLANAKVRRAPLLKRMVRTLAFEIETPTRVYHLRGLTANSSTISAKYPKAIEKEHYENYLKWMSHIENQITLASENCHMQLAEFYLKDHQIRASQAETRHGIYIVSLKLLLQDNAGQQCLRRFMETYVIALRVAYSNISQTNLMSSTISSLYDHAISQLQ